MNPVRFSTFAALRHRNFRLFYSGQMISLTGSWMQSVAFSWLVLVLTNSAFYLGLVGALQTLPVLLFSFLGGVVADHTSKLRLLFITQTVLMLLALVLGVLVEVNVVQVWMLCALVFLSGTAMAFDIPVRQAFIVDLVGKPDLPNAIALNSTLFNATRVMGPAVGGVIIGAVGMANCFFLNSASFLAVLLALMLIKLPPTRDRALETLSPGLEGAAGLPAGAPGTEADPPAHDHGGGLRHAVFRAAAHPGPGHPGGGSPGLRAAHGHERPGGLCRGPHPGPAAHAPPAHALVSGGPGPVPPGPDGPGALPQLLRRPGLAWRWPGSAW